MIQREVITYSTRHIEQFDLYALVTVAVITFYDHVLTFSQEIDHIWRRKFTAVTLLFVVIRYLTLFKTALVFHNAWGNSPSSCTLGMAWYNALDCSICFMHAIFDALQVWVLWDRKWLPSLSVLTMSMITPAYTVYRVSRASILPETSLFPTPFGGCLVNIGMSYPLWHKLRIVSRTSAIITDAVIIVMTWVKTYGTYRMAARVGLRPTYAALLLRDGTLYFGALFFVNTSILVVNNRLSRLTRLNAISSRTVQTIIMLFIWPTTLTSILISRFLLNIRGAYPAGKIKPEGQCSTINFGPFKIPIKITVGDLGEDLGHSYDIYPSQLAPSSQSIHFSIDSAESRERRIHDGLTRHRLSPIEECDELDSLSIDLPLSI